MKIKIDYFGVPGEGRTVKEAKQDAGRKIEQIVQNLSPRIYSHRGHSVVIYRTTEGEAYDLIHPDSEGCRHSTSFGGDVEESAIAHLLQITRQAGEFDIPDWVPNEMHPRLTSDWKSNDAFQRAYRAAEGAGEANPHQWACENMGKF